MALRYLLYELTILGCCKAFTLTLHKTFLIKNYQYVCVGTSESFIRRVPDGRFQELRWAGTNSTNSHTQILPYLNNFLLYSYLVCANAHKHFSKKLFANSCTVGSSLIRSRVGSWIFMSDGTICYSCGWYYSLNQKPVFATQGKVIPYSLDWLNKWSCSFQSVRFIITRYTGYNRSAVASDSSFFLWIL